MMVYTLFALTFLLGFLGAVFFGLFVEAYLHTPVGAKVEVRHRKKKIH